MTMLTSWFHLRVVVIAPVVLGACSFRSFSYKAIRLTVECSKEHGSTTVFYLRTNRVDSMGENTIQNSKYRLKNTYLP